MTPRGQAPSVSWLAVLGYGFRVSETDAHASTTT